MKKRTKIHKDKYKIRKLKNNIIVPIEPVLGKADLIGLTDNHKTFTVKDVFPLIKDEIIITKDQNEKYRDLTNQEIVSKISYGAGLGYRLDEIRNAFKEIYK